MNENIYKDFVNKGPDWKRLIDKLAQRPEFVISHSDDREDRAKLERISANIQREARERGHQDSALEQEIRRLSELAEKLSAPLLDPYVLGAALSYKGDDILRGVDAVVLVNGGNIEEFSRASIISLDATTSGNKISEKIQRALVTIQNYGGDRVYIPDDWRDDEEFSIDGVIRQSDASAKALSASTVGYIPWEFLKTTPTREQLTKFRQLLAFQLVAQGKAFAKHLAINVLSKDRPFTPPTDQSVKGLKAWFESYENRTLSPRAKNQLLLGIGYLNLVEEITSKVNAQWGLVGDLMQVPMVGEATNLTSQLRGMYAGSILSKMSVGSLAVALESEKPLVHVPAPRTEQRGRPLSVPHHASSNVYHGNVQPGHVNYRAE